MTAPSKDCRSCGLPANHAGEAWEAKIELTHETTGKGDRIIARLTVYLCGHCKPRLCPPDRYPPEARIRLDQMRVLFGEFLDFAVVARHVNQDLFGNPQEERRGA